MFNIFNIKSVVEHESLLDNGIDNRVMGAWEFPDPVMQADADLRRQIAELTAENTELLNRVSELEMLEIYEHNLNQKEEILKLEETFFKERLNRAIENAVKIRTATLKNELAAAYMINRRQA